MKTIKLPCYEIKVEIENGGGTICSNLKTDSISTNDPYNPCIDALESLILAHAIAGVNIEDPAYIEGIETAVDAIINNI